MAGWTVVMLDAYGNETRDTYIDEQLALEALFDAESSCVEAYIVEL